MNINEPKKVKLNFSYHLINIRQQLKVILKSCVSLLKLAKVPVLKKPLYEQCL